MLFGSKGLVKKPKPKNDGNKGSWGPRNHTIQGPVVSAAESIEDALQKWALLPLPEHLLLLPEQKQAGSKAQSPKALVPLNPKP